MDKIRGIVYALKCTCHPERKYKYVGKTIRPIRDRMRGHKYQSRSGNQLPIYRWMRKHGEENIEAHTIEEVFGHEELNRAEIKYIDKYGTHVSRGGLNSTLGGDGSIGTKHSEETKKRISESLKGRRHSEETIRRMVESRKGYSASDETRERMRESALKRVRSSEEIERFRSLGASLNDAQREEIRALLKDPEITFGEIAKEYGVSGGAISRYAREVGLPITEGKKRAFSGDRNPRTVVTEEVFEEIIASKGKIPAREIAKKLGIGVTTVYRVWRGDHFRFK